jgi:RHS repeat-associated protein
MLIDVTNKILFDSSFLFLIHFSNYPWWDDGYRSDDTSTTSAYTQNYEYDKIGNILELAHTAASSGDNFTRTFDYGTTNNFLTGITVGSGIGTYTYDYDEVGNQVKENTTRNYEWDHSNNMRCFFNQAGMGEPTIYAQYLYSGGQRIKKLVRTSGGGYESICYVGGIYEYKTDGTDEQNMLHIQSIARVRTGDAMGDISPAIKYNLEDHLGSSMTLLDDVGDFVNREEYYPFGETSFGSYALKRYRFQGKEKDSESGLYYFGARYYCCASCRFVSVDVVVQAWESPFAGMGNNPVKMVDPDGNLALDGDPEQTAKSNKESKSNADSQTPPGDPNAYVLPEHTVYGSELKARDNANLVSKNSQIDWKALYEKYTPDKSIHIKDYSESEKDNSWFTAALNAIGTMGTGIYESAMAPLDALEEANKGDSRKLTYLLNHTAQMVQHPLETTGQDMAIGVLTWYHETGEAIKDGDLAKEREQRVIGALTVILYVLPLKGVFKGKTYTPKPNYPVGSFSIYNWEGYPSNIPRPKGPFRLIVGEEYKAARTAANDANRILAKDLDLPGKRIDIHEVTPVKFGGSPTNINNKVFLDRDFHQQVVSPFWYKIQKSAE